MVVRRLIYSAYADGVLAAAAIVAEADGIINKSGLGSELRHVIRRVARGKNCLQPLPRWLGDTLRARCDHEQQAIFGMLLAGVAREEIATTLELSEAELESRMWAMLRSLETPLSEERR